MLDQVSLHNNEISGGVNDLYLLFSDGQLQMFEVDLDKMNCYYCTSGV
jgi:hypothetical protein